MRKRSKPSIAASSVLAGCLLAATAGAATSDRWNIPVATKRLDNGLTVVVSEDHSSPTVGIAVVYRVGIRTEPRNRTGFAHLFEHLMFEGTPNAGHGVFDRVTTDGGGDNNGSTHPDFTSYIDRAPVSALEPLLWLEADRMKTLAFAQEALDGQRDVVKEEINVNVLNQPYGGFAETDLPQLAFQKWENAHDGYGSFDDLDKAGLDDVRGFHRDFYGPNNAVLGIAGDVTPEQGFALAQKYFGKIAARATPPRPDVSEELNTAEKRIVQGDALAKLPALAIGWKMPPRGSRDQAAMIVLGELLAGGDASRLHQALVKGGALAVQVDDFTGSGSPWEYDGPTLYTLAVVYKTTASADLVLATIDGQIARIQKEGVDAETLQGLKTRMLADWYDELEPFVDRAEKLAVLQAIWGDARVANQVPDLIDGVTSADIQRVAATYLTRANRTIIDRKPDFMLADGDPARSDVRAKNKPKPAPRQGRVNVGGAQPVKAAATAPATAPASTVSTVPTPKALAPKAPEQKAPGQQAPEQKAPEQKAPEQKAPEQKAPEQKAPEQKAPEQKAAEQKATEQKAPEQKAAGPKAPEQKAPEQKAPEQKAPEQKAAGPKAPEQQAPGQKASEQKVSEQKAPEQKATGKKATPSKPSAATAAPVAAGPKSPEASKPGEGPAANRKPGDRKAAGTRDGKPAAANADARKAADAKSGPGSAASAGSASEDPKR